MSLLDQFSTEFIIMEKQRIADGEGGFITEWHEGESINLALRHDQTMQARRAMAEGVTSVYTFLAPKNCGLDFHDVLKRVSDGQCFRITSNSGDSITPPMATMDLTSFTAEKWELTA